MSPNTSVVPQIKPTRFGATQRWSSHMASINKKVLPAETAESLARLIQDSPEPMQAIMQLLRHVPRENDTYDWNVGNILINLKPNLVIDALSKIEFPGRLYDSVGIAWALGQYQNRDPKIMAFLQTMVDESNNSEAWWRAAFSLEKLGAGQGLNILRRSLKKKTVKSLDYYLQHLANKEAVVGLLTLSTSENIASPIYPRLKALLLNSTNKDELLNTCWLIGRLNLLDHEIITRIQALVNDSDRQIRHYAYEVMQHNPNDAFYPLLSSALRDPDPVTRRSAVRGLVSTGDQKWLAMLEDRLDHEDNTRVVAALTSGIYTLKNPQAELRQRITRKSFKNENGLISDESDKWYQDASIYNYFSEAEDPEDVAFHMVTRALQRKQIVIRNPIDLATGTGRTLRSILNEVDYEGTLYGIDMSRSMCDYIDRYIRRERRYSHAVKVIESSIANLPSVLQEKSTFIISSFGFPSKFTQTQICIDELYAVYSLLDDDGILCTIGWDETFNDELNMMWYKYVPDSIEAVDFEEWRRKRASAFTSPRNCNLSWLKTNVRVPLQFPTLEEAAFVMGQLFGRDAAQDIINSGRTSWEMAYGITFNTKEEIGKILKGLKP